MNVCVGVGVVRELFPFTPTRMSVHVANGLCFFPTEHNKFEDNQGRTGNLNPSVTIQLTMGIQATLFSSNPALHLLSEEDDLVLNSPF